MLIVDPWHWLDKDGDLPVDNARLRRQVLRVARLIEYGGPLLPLHTRETLVEPPWCAGMALGPIATAGSDTPP